jgi:hypothetical protein
VVPAAHGVALVKALLVKQELRHKDAVAGVRDRIDRVRGPLNERRGADVDRFDVAGTDVTFAGDWNDRARALITAATIAATRSNIMRFMRLQ